MKKHLHGKRHMIARRSVGEGRRKRNYKRWNSISAFHIGVQFLKGFYEGFKATLAMVIAIEEEVKQKKEGENIFFTIH